MPFHRFYGLTISWVLSNVGHFDKEVVRARLRYWDRFAVQLGLFAIRNTLDYSGAHCVANKEG